MRHTGNVKRTSNIISVKSNLPFNYIEAYKSLRTNLNFVSIDKNLKKLLVTSSIPGEGKTTVAINLAITLAQAGSKVILIDCDLRKPSVNKYLHVKSKISGGLTNILSAKADLESNYLYFSDLNLYVLTSGAIPPNPAELLSSERMTDFLDNLNERFDYIVIDTPPVSVVTDAAVLSRNADGVIFVLRQNFTKIETAKVAKKNLEIVGANVIGCVLNAFNAGNSSKSYAYYSYDYSNK